MLIQISIHLDYLAFLPLEWALCLHLLDTNQTNTASHQPNPISECMDMLLPLFRYFVNCVRLIYRDNHAPIAQQGSLLRCQHRQFVDGLEKPCVGQRSSLAFLE